MGRKKKSNDGLNDEIIEVVDVEKIEEILAPVNNEDQQPVNKLVESKPIVKETKEKKTISSIFKRIFSVKDEETGERIEFDANAKIEIICAVSVFLITVIIGIVVACCF